jgi:L-lysine exporter family protein LysE/ArgO
LLPAGGPAPPLMPALAATMAVTWFNPHVYLDTVVLVGSVSARYGDDRAMFAAGAVLASFVFFFALGFGARLLRPVFARPFAWRVLEMVTGAVMWAIAVDLLAG